VLRRSDGTSFAASRARYLEAAPGQLTRRDAKGYVRIAVGSPTFTTTAMLDTGSTYSVLDADVAEEWGAFDEADAPTVELATRHGLLRGCLVRRQVQLLADEGESLEVDTTFWVSRDWQGGHFLGYAGFLQRIRFALDPLTNSLHFGAALD